MTNLLKLSEIIPERTLRLFGGWTIEDLASAEVSKLAKIRGIGLKTAQSVIKAARQQMQKEQEDKWDKERQQLRERIKIEERILAIEQSKLAIQQELAGTSARIRRIREANA